MPHTLLLADDSVTIQRVIELTFADEDVNVVAVSDGEQAIARLDAQPPDIVLADVGMPGRNGYEVAQYIKGSPHLSHIPVVLLTGAFEPVDQARVAEAGCDGVLAKPFEPQLVIGRVKELLGQTKGGSDAAASPAVMMAPEDAAPAPAADAVPKPDTADLANYFDRLDAAFGSGPAAAGSDSAVNDATLAMEQRSQGDASSSTGSVPPEIDWYGAAPADTQADAPLSVPDQIATIDRSAEVPLSYASPAAAFGTADATTPNAPAWPAAATFAMGALPAGHAAVEAPAFAAAPLRRDEPEAPAFAAAPLRRDEPEALEAPKAPVPLPPLADAFAALLAAEQGDTLPNVAWPAAASTAAAPTTDAIAEQVTQRVLGAIGPRIDASVRAAVADLVSQLAERLIREEIERIKGTIK